MFGLIAIVLSLIQAILMLFRQAALLILAGVLPLAAAGSIAPMTRTWVRKVTAWMLALICYKPAAAAVYATAFTMVGSGRSPRTALMGFVMMLLSVLMLPALMKFFTWTTGTIGSSGGGGGQLLGAATMGAIALGAIRPSGAGGAAQDQAAHINSSLGHRPAAVRVPRRVGRPHGPDGGGGPGSRWRTDRRRIGRVARRPGWPPTWPDAGPGAAGHRGLEQAPVPAAQSGGPPRPPGVPKLAPPLATCQRTGCRRGQFRRCGGKRVRLPAQARPHGCCGGSARPGRAAAMQPGAMEQEDRP